MLRFFRVVVVLLVYAGLLAWPSRSWAGYANVAVPSGVTGSGASFFYQKSASNAAFVSGFVTQPAFVPVGGRMVSMPAKFRIASNGASYLVAAARATPAGMGAQVALWMAGLGLTWAATEWLKQPPATQYNFGNTPMTDNRHLVNHETQNAACNAIVGGQTVPYMNVSSLYYSSSWNGSGCVVYWNRINATTGAVVQANQGPGTIGLTTTTVSNPAQRDATEADFTNASATPYTSLPDAVLNEVAAYKPLPVESVTLNPNGSNVPQPYRIPEGTPVPVPNTSPQQYKQPVVDVIPKGTATEPWRVDLQPKEITGTDPNGLTDPATVSIDPNTPTDPTPVPGCGLPDTPACKIDENGTPTGNADAIHATSKAALDAAGDAISGLIGSPVKPTSTGWSLAPGGFGIPTSSCTPFTWGSRLGTITVNPCTNTFILLVRDMLAWSMYAFTLLYVWRRTNEFLERA